MSGADLGGCDQWGQFDFVSEFVELIDGVVAGAARMGSLKVVVAQVLENGPVGEHVPDRGDHRVLDRDEGSHRASPGSQSLIPGLEVCPVGSG